MSYSRFNTEDIVLSSDTISVPIWSNGSESIAKSELTTSSIQLAGESGRYYMDVSCDDKVQFAIAYAHISGSGSINYYTSQSAATDGYSPSRTNYGQYRSLVLGDEESNFYFGATSGSVSNYFWAISIGRARYRESLQAGALNLTLSTGSGETATTLSLCDGGKYNEAVRYIDSGRVYNIYSASYSTASYNKVYGYYLPDIGTILLDGCLLSSSGIAPDNFSGSSETGNNSKNAGILFNAINEFSLKEQETITSNYIFVRAKNSEFNYSINPSNITSTGEIKQSIMINQPETFITSVGLYNDANELLAVAKLSKPLSKTFNKEALIRIKLDY